ncbi:MAG TPA: hypothetical protein VNT52_11785 [Acidimicrobiales bacterium]|nr:hypothetical protein [Acidimicrobiales bacterium]
MKRRKQFRVFAGVSLALALTATACGGGDDTPAGQTAQPADTQTVPERGGPDGGRVVFAHSAGVPQIVKLPQSMAVAELTKRGYTVSEEHFQTTTDSIQAVIRGDAVLGNTAPANFFSAVAEGADLVAVIGGGRPDYHMMARTGVTDVCSARRVGINNPISTTDQLVRMEIAKCRNANPQILSVALTPNRVQALVANELDAAPAQFSSVPQIERDFAGRITFLSNMAKDYADIINTITFVKRDTLEQRPRLVYDFVQSQLQVVRAAYQSPTDMTSFASGSIRSVTAGDMAAAVNVYLQNEVFPKDGGLSEREVAATYKSLRDTKLLDADFDPERFVNRTNLALAIRGLD